LGIEQKGEFALLTFGKFPTTKSSTVSGREAGRRDLADLTQESGDARTVWDLGTYELIEGSFEKGRMSLYLSGRRLEGDCALRTQSGRWKLRNSKRRGPATELP
jgi:hypothetical protein